MGTMTDNTVDLENNDRIRFTTDEGAVYEGDARTPELDKAAETMTVLLKRVNPEDMAIRNFATYYNTDHLNTNIASIETKIPDFVNKMKAVLRSTDGSSRDRNSKKAIFEFLLEIAPDFDTLVEEKGGE